LDGIVSVSKGGDMKRRYFVLGATLILAIALAVPALGGPSNPVSTAAKAAKDTASKALKKAKKANRNAKAAQNTADQALSDAAAARTAANNAQTTANEARTAAEAAQTTANQALTEAQNPTATKLGLVDIADASPSNSNDKAAVAVCPAGKVLTGGWGFTSATPNVKYQGSIPFYEASVALGFEDPATGANWTVSSFATCINE
jgi:hypothetical protein